MKKRVGLLIFSFLFVVFSLNTVSFSATTTAVKKPAPTAESIVAGLLDFNKVPDKNVDSIIKVAGIEKLSALEQTAITELTSAKMETAEDFSKMTDLFAKCQALRDVRYKTQIMTLDKIKVIKDKNLKMKAILKFEADVNKNMSYDKKVQSTLEKMLDKLVATGAVKSDNTAFREKFIQLVEKYYSQRAVQLYIQKQIQGLKKINFEGQVDKLILKAQSYEKAKQLGMAGKLYEEAMKYCYSPTGFLKKISEIDTKLKRRAIMLVVENKRMAVAPAPIQIKGTNYIPSGALALISPEIKAVVENNLITVSKGDMKASLFIKSKADVINAQTPLNNVAFVDKGATYIPIRVLSTGWGISIKWDNASQVILIDDLFKTGASNVNTYTIIETGFIDTTKLIDIKKKISSIAMKEVQDADLSILK